jgi:disulfide bond formation protein DsbB
MSTVPTFRRPSPLAFLGSRRAGNLLGFLACAGLLAFAYYLQFVKGLEPCPLCIFQRVLMAGTGLAFLAAAIHHPARRWAAHLYGALTAVFALVGAGFATRHVWLQHTPEAQRPACGPGLDFLIGTFGPFEVLQRVLRGSGECGAVDWTFLGRSIPEWTLGVFIAMAIYAVYLSFRD